MLANFPWTGRDLVLWTFILYVIFMLCCETYGIELTRWDNHLPTKKPDKEQQPKTFYSVSIFVSEIHHSIVSPLPVVAGPGREVGLPVCPQFAAEAIIFPFKLSIVGGPSMIRYIWYGLPSSGSWESSIGREGAFAGYSDVRYLNV